MSRTLGEIAREYDGRRNKILNSIAEGKVSASMSGIEYYPKPWAELDMSNPVDAYLILTNLTWDGQRHDYSALISHLPRSGEP